MNTAKIVRLIETKTNRVSGNGPADPVRIVTQYWTTNGQIVAENDPFPVNETLMELRSLIYDLKHRAKRDGLTHSHLKSPSGIWEQRGRESAFQEIIDWIEGNTR